MKAASVVKRTSVLLLVSAWTVLRAQTPEEILLEEFWPQSIFRVPGTRVEKAGHPIFDVHSQDYARSDADVERWVQTMDAVGVEKTIIISGATRARFDVDFSRLREPDFVSTAIAEP